MKTANKIFTASEATLQVRSWQSSGEKIVFTNGCFDILHLGHVDYLEKAKSMGSKLVVGLNTDLSVARIKGDARPIIDEQSRARVMAALEFVDMVVYFGEDTPYELIAELRPDVLVKGNDYLAENIIGAEIVKKNGGEVKTIQLIEGYSTSSIIKKIKG